MSKLRLRKTQFLRQASVKAGSAKSATKSGFTMIELTITMAFVAVLCITVAIITTNLLSIYQKGLTVKAVNSVGRGLIDELTTAINTAPSVDTTSLCTSLLGTDDANASAEAIANCKKDHAYKYIFQDISGVNPDPNNRSATDEATYQYGGVFCTGYYSYMWTTFYGQQAVEGEDFPDTENTGRALSLTYLGNDGEEHTIVNPRLIRIEDRNYRVCSAVTDRLYGSLLDPDYGTDHYNINITQLANSTLANPIPAPKDGSLSEFDLDLMLYEFTVFPISQDSVTYRTYMSGTFILATTRGDVDIQLSGDYCSLNTDDDASSSLTMGSELNYCAINKFNFAARTAGV